MKKISLIIPVYNGERYLRQCLDSAMNQSYDNYEIIVVDDGSTDQSYEIAKEYQKCCPFFKLIHRLQNRGLVYSWHEGVQASSGEYLAFLDSDDWVDREYLKQLALGIRENADIVCCNHNRVYCDHTELYTERLKSGIYTGEQLRTKVFPILLNNGGYFSRGISPHRCGKLFRRALFVENLKYSKIGSSYGEDLNIFFPVLLDCQKLMVLPDVIGLYYYRQNAGSIIHTYKREMYRQITSLRDQLFFIMKEKNVYDFTQQLECDFWCMFLEYVKNETKAENLFLSSGEVIKHYRKSKEITPCHNLSLNFANKLLLCCLQSNRQVFIYLWMLLYAFVKKG